MKPRKEIYSLVNNRLTQLIDQGVLKYVDMQKGQLQRPDKTFPIPFPAVLIEVPTIEYSPMVGNQVEGMAIVTLIVAFDNRHFSFGNSKDKTESEDLMDLLDAVAEQISYLRGETFTDLTILSEDHVPYDYKGLQIHRMRFNCNTYHYIKTNESISITRGAEHG